MARYDPKDARMELLDRALEGRPPEVKARVLNLILRMGIDPEDEFFLIFIALGQLQTLIEDSPQDWQTLFESFEGELRAWERKNIQTLEHLVHQAQAIEELAISTKSLTDTLMRLIEVCADLTPSLKGSIQTSNKWINDLQIFYRKADSDNKAISQILHQHKTDFPRQQIMMQSQMAMIEEMNRVVHALLRKEPPTTMNHNGAFWAGFLGSFGAFVLSQIVLSYLRFY